MRKTYMCLGRYGDIINILPLMYAENQRGNRPLLCVAKEFESVLDGVSYVDRLVWDGPYNQPKDALNWLQRQAGGQGISILQHYRNPFDQKRETDSYATEGWRCGGALSEYGKHPLIFDRRNLEREAKVGHRPEAVGLKKMILVCLDGVSSPFPHRKTTWDAIVSMHVPDTMVVDISGVRAERIYDMIGFYDRAACLVSVDTVHLHLARAAKVPVVAIINNGFFGSVVPPGAVSAIRYGEDNVPQKVVEAIGRVLAAQDEHRFILHSTVIHACHKHGDTERHKRAQDTWPAASEGESVIQCYATEWDRDATAIGDPRTVPPLKSILKKAIDQSITDNDVVIFCNSDVSLTPGSMGKMARHAALFGAFSVRRVEPGATFTHIGRDLFGFRVGWLKDRMPSIPDFYIGAPAFDLAIAALIRKYHGIVSTMENIGLDFYPSEMDPGMVVHEPHASNWSGHHEFTLPANVHNVHLAKAWFSAECPSFVL